MATWTPYTIPLTVVTIFYGNRWSVKATESPNGDPLLRLFIAKLLAKGTSLASGLDFAAL